jgi:hypothetical protein
VPSGFENWDQAAHTVTAEHVTILPGSCHPSNDLTRTAPNAIASLGTARSAEFSVREAAGPAELSGELVRGTHPPRVGHELGQPLGVHLRQPQHHQRPAVVAGRGEEDLGLAEQESLLLSLVAG